MITNRDLQIGLIILVIVIIVFKILDIFFHQKWFIGARGERLTCNAIEKLSRYPLIKNSIYTNSKGETSEIDIIMIHPTGLYVIENKQFKGWIFGEERQFQWTQTLPNKKKYKFYNPVMQNRKHIATLSEILLENQNIFYNIVVFSDSCVLKKVKIKSDIVVGCRKDAVKAIKKRIREKPTILQDVQLLKIQERLNECAKFDKKSRKKHIEAIQELTK